MPTSRPTHAPQPRALGITALLLAFAASAVARADLDQARALLEGRSGKLAVTDFAEGERVYLLDLQSGELQLLSADIDCTYPELSPDGTRVVYTQGKNLVLRTVAGDQLDLFPGYHARWWLGPGGEEWLYYASHFATTKWPAQSGGSTTWRKRLSDGTTEKVLDWKTTAGPSPDGKLLGSDYLSVLMFDDSATPTVLNGGERGCYASLSPDDGRRIMHLDIDHNRVLVHDLADQLVWQCAMPEETNYVNMPRWSTHPDYVVFTSREANDSFSVFLVKLSNIDAKTGLALPGKTGPVRLLDARTGGRSWLHPFLWIEPPPPPDGGPPDSAPVDAGPTDAAPADAGPDMGDLGQPTADLPVGCSVARTAAKGALPAGLLLLVAVLIWRTRRRG